MTPDTAKYLAAIVTLYSNRLDATYDAIRRRVRDMTPHSSSHHIGKLRMGGLIETCAWSREDHICFRPTAAGWAAAGVTPPLGLEPV